MDRSDIPSGLNRIKTRRIPREDSSGGDDSPVPAVARSDRAAGTSFGRQKASEGRKTVDSKGFRKGKKIARWFSSYLFVNDSIKTSPENELKKREAITSCKGFSNDGQFVDFKDVQGNRSAYQRKVPDTKKSFSHELGPRGGIRPSHPRAHSYSDLKELVGSFSSKCHDAKEVVNVELALFARDLSEILQKDPVIEIVHPVENLLHLARNCMEMSCDEFQESCEGIVQELAEKRLSCQVDVLKQLLTRMLFILTRCTRLMQFQKDGGAINEDSLHKLKWCLERVPSVEMGWSKKPEIAPMRQHQYSVITEAESDTTDSNGTCGANGEYHPKVAGLPKSILDSLPEHEESLDEVDSVICRICEEDVPTTSLESHSYICAYADKCDVDGVDLDDRLGRLSEILEQIGESYAQNIDLVCSSPEISRVQNHNSVNRSISQSPKVLEWHSKGLQGMFEDLHEMDTAFLDESIISNLSGLKGHLNMRLASSNDNMTSASSNSTPRASHFDLFWLEQGNTSHAEDANQINKLAEIARRVESIDFKMEGAVEILDICMQNLRKILCQSKIKALVVDTFGNRLRNLLEEKYLLANECRSHKGSDEALLYEEGGRSSRDHSFQSSTSTPHSSHKERTSIDDFDIIKPISRGAFGEVSLARKRTTGDLFAIKVLKKLHMIRKNDIERILAERNILITVRNPFVVRFFYSFTCRDNLYLVMEYLNGGDLYSLLRKVGCFEEDIARTYIAELVLALEYLHSLGIVHRDLKPDNILIARDGHIKLTDFGLSKIGLLNKAVDLSGSGSSNSILLDPGNMHESREYSSKEPNESRHSAVGTPDYLAPEILLGTEHGHAADWWSVGIILFEFITGIPPFSAELPERIFENILNRKIPLPEVPEEMSFEAKDLIERLLSLDPNQRLGANGAPEAAFVPNPESADDTSYFLSRYSSTSLHYQNLSDCLSEATDSSSPYDNEGSQQCEWRDFSSSQHVNLSTINFSFKNLSQLASMNYDVLIESGRLPKSSTPLKGPNSRP
ncbi:protein kinase superfamily protein isoform X2 [Wolffia australiana]